MANWGQPDFDARTPEQQAIDKAAPALRAKLESEGHMSAWMGDGPAGFDKDTVRKHCVENAAWQKIRLSMKGKPTHEKLFILFDWWKLMFGKEPFATTVQIYNYLGALRRGGQLDSQNRIRKYI